MSVADRWSSFAYTCVAGHSHEYPSAGWPCPSREDIASVIRAAFEEILRDDPGIDREAVISGAVDALLPDLVVDE